MTPGISEVKIAAGASLARTGKRGGVRTLRTLAEMKTLAAAWESLAAGRNPVIDFAYGYAWAAGMSDDRRPFVMAAGEPDTLAIAPLVAQRGAAGWLSVLAAEMYEIMDFPHASSEAVSELARAIVRTGRPLELKRVHAESPVVAALQEAYRGRGIVRLKATGGSPWIPLDESWNEPESHLESGRRSDLRRARRNAEKLGVVETAVIVPERANLGVLMEEAFQVEAAGWKGAHGTALAADAQRGSFFKRYAERACAKGILRICILRIGGAPAAAQIAIESGGRFDLLRAGYDEKFSRCSPGSLLTAETIRYAARQGLKSYEFNGDVEPWTRLWTQDEHACCSIRAYPFSPRGAFALASDGSRAWARKLRERRAQ